MNLSPSGLKLIARFEGLSLKVYNDAVRSEKYPKGHATIGYGHLLHHGAFTPGDPQTITKEEAEEMLRGDAAEHAAAVNFVVTKPLTQNQFDALVSLSFNIGTGLAKDDDGNFVRPKPGGKGIAGSSLVRYINSSVHMSGPEIRKLFCLFCKAGGVTNKGLLNRRNAEATVFLTLSDSDK